MEMEETVATFVQSGLKIVESLILRGIHILLTPFDFASRFASASAGPVLRTLLFLSLLPPIGLFSLSAGIVVPSWLPVGWSEKVYLQYGEGTSPFATVSLPKLTPTQPYDISLDLIVPLTSSNQELGNFMTTLTLKSYYNETVVSVRRPSLVYPSYPRLPSLLSSSFPTTTLSIPLLTSFLSQTSYSAPFTARIEVGRNDGWRSVGRGEGKEVVVYDAYLIGEVKLSGIRAFVRNHRLLATIATTGLFFVSSTFSALFIFVWLNQSFSSPPSKPSRLIKAEPEKPLVKKEEEDKEGLGLGLRRRRSRLSQEQLSQPT